MLRRLGIRGKVLAALSVPVLVLFLLAGIVSWQSIQDVQTRRAAQDVLSSLEYSRQIVGAMQDERDASLPLFGPNGGSLTPDGLEQLRDATDTAIQRFENVAAKIDFEALDPSVQATFEDFEKQLGTLSSVRRYVDERQVALPTVDAGFGNAITSAVEFPVSVGDRIDDRDLGRILRVQGDLAKLGEMYAHERAVGLEVIQSPQDYLSEIEELTEEIKAADEMRLALDFDVDEIGLETEFTEVLLTYETTSFGSLRKLVELYPETRILAGSVKPDTWTAAADDEISVVQSLVQESHQLAKSRADSVAASALRGAVLTITATVIGVVLSIIIALSIAGGIVRPLRRLTDAAGTVRDELPHLVEQVAIPGQGPDLRLTRIPVTSRDEIGRLAAAFNEVNATTIEVAQEQAALRASIAEMFVNVARRDQVLLNRQLSFIDALERSEENPKILADLFRLDHLATRMRRNAESLLVLAGIDTGRRLREALPTSDVIRTASSEIEHYERIQLDLPVDPLMLGHTALPAAHMLAELLENATVFSDPGTPVYVSTGIDDTAVIITIQDQGLGMLPEELDMANTKIAATSASDVLGSQRLGLYVVGRIAARLGSQVTLSKGPDDKGTLATVRMPLVLFVDPQSIPLTAPTQRQVESFVLPEEAAAVVHDAAYAPAPVEGVQDVAAGAYGSAENPAEAVDIAALVEGTTETGLPKRRSHGTEAPTWDMSGGDTAAASAIPLAPSAESLAGAAAAQPEEAWKPPMMQTSTPLVTRNPGATPHAAPGLPSRAPAAPEPAAAPTSGLPTRSPSTSTGSTLPVRTSTGSQPPVPQSAVGGPTASGLPARRPTGPGGPTAPEAVATSSATGPANVEGRTAMFAGFRSRRAELQAAAVQEAGAEPAIGSADAVERLAAAATSAASFFRRDAGEATPADDAAETPMVIPALVDDDEDYGDAAFAPDAPPVEAPVAAPAAAAAPPVAPAPPQPAAQPAAPGEDEPWQPQWQVAGQPAPAPAAAQAVTPAGQSEDEPWQPEWKAADAEVPEWRPEWPVDAEEPAAQPAPPAPPAWQPPVPEPQPVAEAPAWQAPVPEPQPVAEAPAWQPPVPEPQPVAEAPAWQPTPGPWVTAEPVSEPVVEAVVEPVAEPVVEPVMAPVADAAPPAPAAPRTPAWPWLQQEPEAAPAESVAAQPPAYVPPTFGAPTGPAVPVGAPSPGAGQPYEGAAFQSSVNFADLVQGPTRRSMREQKRRGLFRRHKPAPAAPAPTAAAPTAPAPTPPAYVPPVATAAPAAAPAPAPAPMAGLPGAAAPVEMPVRQSAWGAPTNGSHAVAEPVQPEPPEWQPPVFQAPPFTEAPPAPEPTPVVLEPEVEQAWAPQFQAPAPAAPFAPMPERAVPAVGAWQAPTWSEPQQEAWPSHEAPAARPALAPEPASGLPSRTPAAPAAPAAYGGPTSFTPQPMFGFDDEMTSMLAQRADIAQQALAELNQLSMYRPQAVATSSASSLQRRTPGTIPAAPAIATTSSAPRPARDANQVRSLLSSFQSGTSRGRQLADGDGAPTNTGDNGLAGSEEGPAGHGEPVTTPDGDLTPRDATW